MKRPVVVALAAGPAGLVLAALLACTPVRGHHTPSPKPTPYSTCSAVSEGRCTPGTSSARPPKPVLSSPSVGAPSKPCKTATTPVSVPTTSAPQTPVSVTSGVSTTVTTSPPATRVTSRQAPVTPVASRAVTPSSEIGPPLAQTGPLVGQQAVAGCGVTAVGLLLTWLGMNRKNNRRERGGHR